MEIQFFHQRVTEKHPKLLTDHIQRMASGEAPFFPTTLSLLYDKLVEKAFTNAHPTVLVPAVALSASVPFAPLLPKHRLPPPTFLHLPPSTLSLRLPVQAPAFTHVPVPPITITSPTRLKCRQWGEPSRLRDLVDGLRCPRCPTASKKARKAKILMLCSSCNQVRGGVGDNCERKACGKTFLQNVLVNVCTNVWRNYLTLHPAAFG